MPPITTSPFPFGSLRIAIALLLLWCCAFLGTMIEPLMQSKAWAQNFDAFSIDLPSDWAYAQDIDTYAFTAPQESCIVTVLIAPHQDTTYREFVIGFYQNLQGKNAKNIDNGFTFDMTIPNDVSGKVRVSMQNENFAVVSAMGQCFPYKEVISSLRILDKNKQPLQGNVRPYPLLDTP